MPAAEEALHREHSLSLSNLCESSDELEALALGLETELESARNEVDLQDEISPVPRY